MLEAPAAGRAGRALVGRQSRVRLHEVGPRLELEIVKVSDTLRLQLATAALGRNATKGGTCEELLLQVVTWEWDELVGQE